MKTLKTLGFIMLFSMLTSSLFAQWMVTGNSGASGNTLGTTDAYPVNFYAGGSQWMVLTTAGNLGIGTTGPVQLLDVNGNINVASNQWYGINNQRVLSNDGTNNIWLGVGAYPTGISGAIRNTHIGVNAGTAVTSANDNTLVGYSSGTALTTGLQNTLVGSNAGSTSTTSTGNSFYGFEAGKVVTTGGDNVIVGAEAGSTALTTEENNTFVGFQSGRDASGNNNTFIGSYSGLSNTAGFNTFVGNGAGFTNTSGDKNTFIGTSAGRLNDDGYENTFLGYQAGRNNDDGYKNTCGGMQSGYNNTSGIENTFFGAEAGRANTSGGQNVFVGEQAGLNNTTATNNAFIGTDAGRSNTTGSNNTFVGTDAGRSNTVGVANTCIGYLAGYSNATTAGWGWNTFTGYRAGYSTTTGFANAFYGKKAGDNNTVGTNNSFYGSHSGISNVDGDYNSFYGAYSGHYNKYGNSNVMIGDYAGYNNGVYTTDDYNIYIGSNSAYGAAGDYNVIIGAYADATNGSHTNAIAIGANTEVRDDNKMILGDNDINVGIGLSGVTSSPANKLEINAIAGNGTTDVDATTGNGASGLRFRDLTSNSTPTSSPPTTNVLSVDANGDVILIESCCDTCCGAAQAFASNATQRMDEQSELIEDLKKQIEDLKAQLGVSVPGSDGSVSSAIELNATARDLAVLSQNTPNPFNEKATIRFYVPQGMKGVSLKVFDQTGAVHRLFSIAGEGPGSVEIEGSTLAAGQYYYSLMVNGSVVDTKTMILTK